MPDTLVILGAFAFLAAGCIVGWLIRAARSRAEKAAINSGWRDQFDAQATERKRIEHQNRSLMRQVSELQLRVNEQNSSEQTPQAEAAAEPAAPEDANNTQNDELTARRIAKLENEIRNWQARVPPVIERFRQRDADAKRLEGELAEAQALIARYEQQPRFDETRAGAYPPGDPDTGAAASNDMVAAEPDDSLRLVRGIGPATNRRLSKQGFRNLADLANASPEDLERIEETVKGARGQTDNWQRQARELLGTSDE
ncbi:MAG: helix-hairpin-helix domain-containing protein [Woeseiaceae bacterium]|nr:helix-hairpin-helix domain-containing protein [Woeseiaceae bacterium]